MVVWYHREFIMKLLLRLLAGDIRIWNRARK